MTKAEFQKQVRQHAMAGVFFPFGECEEEKMAAFDPELARLLTVRNTSELAVSDYCKARVVEMDANGRK